MLDFAHLEKYRENNRIEAKRALGGLPQSIWETYSAFANSLGGVILLGVEEHPDKSLHTVDLPEPEALISEFWSLVNDPDKASVNILSAEDVAIHEVDGDRIISISVPRAPRACKPVYVEGDIRNTYRRSGEGDYRCTEREIQAMLQAAGEASAQSDGAAMSVSQIMAKMIGYSNGNIHDIVHLTQVWTYAKTIGELEGLPRQTQFILEVAAITHDIACPLCREKYGSADGKRQEEEGPALVRAFLSDTGMPPAQIGRVDYLVGHHHTLHDIDGLDYQILIEADHIVNACEGGYAKETVAAFIDKHMKTESGKRLARAVFQV